MFTLAAWEESLTFTQRVCDLRVLRTAIFADHRKGFKALGNTMDGVIKPTKYETRIMSASMRFSKMFAIA